MYRGPLVVEQCKMPQRPTVCARAIGRERERVGFGLATQTATGSRTRWESRKEAAAVEFVQRGGDCVGGVVVGRLTDRVGGQLSSVDGQEV